MSLFDLCIKFLAVSGMKFCQIMIKSWNVFLIHGWVWAQILSHVFINLVSLKNNKIIKHSHPFIGICLFNSIMT